MEKSDRQSRTFRYRIIELVIWGVISVVLITVGTILYRVYEDSFEVHKIYMPDVSGLIVGSPVNMMGVPVGFVTKAKIINNDQVVVKFKITNKDIHVVEGTVATVEFTGLGGSKSLELYPPDADKTLAKDLVTNSSEYIIVERPKRLRDCWSLLYQMYNKVIEITFNVSKFGEDIKSVDSVEVSGDLKQSGKFIEYTDNWVNNASRRISNTKRIIEILSSFKNNKGK